jgi:hypothetical protein
VSQFEIGDPRDQIFHRRKQHPVGRWFDDMSLSLLRRLFEGLRNSHGDNGLILNDKN